MEHCWTEQVAKNTSFLASKLTKLNTCIVISNASRLELQQELLRFSTRKVSNILRICLLEKAFKAKIRLRLTECQRRNKVAASQVLLEQKDVLQHTWFTDESWFFSDGIEQKRNQYLWALSKDAVESIESQLAPIKVMVWGAVSVNGLIGQHFFS